MTAMDAYRAGFQAGLEAYAHWMDGVQHVGTTGRTLKDAIAGIEQTWNWQPPEGEQKARTLEVYAWEWLTPNPNGTWRGNLGYQPPTSGAGYKTPIPLVRQSDALAAIKAKDAEIARLREALRFYADGEHFGLADESAWDTASGEPANWWCDEAGTATVEDGSIAKAVLNGDAMSGGLSDEGLCDAIDKAGVPYQSQSLTDLLAKAREECQ